jgi:hypothetical protein
MSAQSAGEIGPMESPRTLVAPKAQKSVALRQSATLLMFRICKTGAATENRIKSRLPFQP